jgi:hypothetical protein
MYNKYEKKITDLNDVSFWPVDGILFQELPFVPLSQIII